MGSGSYYCTFSLGEPAKLSPRCTRTFDVEALSDSARDVVVQLQVKAKEEARRRGIDHVINLDDVDY